MSKNSGWLAPLCGPLFAVAGIGAIAIAGDVPDEKATPGEVVSFYSNHETRLIVTVVLSFLASVLLLCFVSHLRNVLGRAAGEGAVLPRVAFAGAVLMVGGLLIDSMLSLTLVSTADNIDPVALQALSALWNYDFVPSAAGMVVIVFAAGLSSLRSRALPRVLAWGALALALLNLTPAGPIAALATAALWIPATGITLARLESKRDTFQHGKLATAS